MLLSRYSRERSTKLPSLDSNQDTPRRNILADASAVSTVSPLENTIHSITDRVSKKRESTASYREPPPRFHPTAAGLLRGNVRPVISGLH
jgi:hypothetical protein